MTEWFELTDGQCSAWSITIPVRYARPEPLLDAVVTVDDDRATDLVRVEERRAKLLGVDPQGFDAMVIEIIQEGIALAELVREAQVAATVAGAQLREGTIPWTTTRC